MNQYKTEQDKIIALIKRLEKLNIIVKCSLNYPWVYIDSINGKTVVEKFQANHGFTIMFLPIKNNMPVKEFTDISKIFNLIRKYK